MQERFSNTLNDRIVFAEILIRLLLISLPVESKKLVTKFSEDLGAQLDALLSHFTQKSAVRVFLDGLRPVHHVQIQHRPDPSVRPRGCPRANFEAQTSVPSGGKTAYGFVVRSVDFGAVFFDLACFVQLPAELKV